MSNGVWRTVRGRRIFIAEGQSLSDAIIKSGKFKSMEKQNDGHKEKSVSEIKEEKQKHWESTISDAFGGLDNLDTEEDLPPYYQHRPYDRAGDKVKHKVSSKYTRILERKGFSEISNNNWRSIRKDRETGATYTITTKFTIEKDTTNPKANATVKVSNVKKNKKED